MMKLEQTPPTCSNPRGRQGRLLQTAGIRTLPNAGLRRKRSLACGVALSDLGPDAECRLTKFKLL